MRSHFSYHSACGGRSMTRTLAALATVALGLSFSFGLGATGVAAKAEPVKIVASFSILGDMVANVVKDRGAVTTIVGPNADAHVYSPTAGDAVAAARADIIFVNGLGFETWSDDLIANSGTKAQVVVATDGITPLTVDGSIDPHAWNALPNGVVYVRNIAQAMAAFDPEGADVYKANADAYVAQLEALHARATAQIAALPQGRRTVVTAHDAFGYLEAAYGLTFLAPVGIDTEAEPSAQALGELITQLKTQRAALFVENITSPALVEQVARETGLKLGGRLFSDALSAQDGPAPTYAGMFEHNLSAIIGQLSALN